MDDNQDLLADPLADDQSKVYHTRDDDNDSKLISHTCGYKDSRIAE